ncbi:MAG TPA: zinc ribbon domain-containing protein [Candidatus Limnocylindrales bacterium]|nr:zinc ribbon domain-containing protein [Candidatus Limnocylindrales bacterium]
MTVDLARRRTRKTNVAAPPAPPIGAAEKIAIGEIEQTVFSCPNCQRPLAIGVHGCPGCGTHLINRVPLGKASLFIALGLVVGLAIGGAGAASAVAAANASRDAEIKAAIAAAIAELPAPVATSAPIATSRPLASAKPPGPAGIPPLTAGAMKQAATVNAELLATVPVLQSALTARDLDTYTVFQVLRSISTNATTGRQLAAHIGGWSGGRALAAELTTFYGLVGDAADEGLDASIRNKEAYRAAAKSMVTLLAGVDAVDALLRSVAGGAGVTIGPPTTP